MTSPAEPQPDAPRAVPAQAGSVDPERLKGLSSPPEEGDSPDSDGGLGGLWRHIPFLPGLVEAIVGTPYDEDEGEEEEEEDLRRWHHVSSQAGETSASRRTSRRPSASRLADQQTPLRLGGPGAGPGRDPYAEEPSALLAPGDAALLTALCPSRFHYSRWHLVYSTLRDGISMQSLLRRAHGKSPTFLLVRDMQRCDERGGGFLGGRWERSSRDRHALCVGGCYREAAAGFCCCNSHAAQTMVPQSHNLAAMCLERTAPRPGSSPSGFMALGRPLCFDWARKRQVLRVGAADSRISSDPRTTIEHSSLSFRAARVEVVVQLQGRWAQ